MKISIRPLGLACIATAALLNGSLCWAQGGETQADARAQTGGIVCDGKQQDRAACLREAGAARQEAQRGGLSNAGAATEDRNALARCQLQPTADRAECEARVKGTGQTSTQGSVLGGGMIRETVTPLPAPTR
ncbi:MAG TPA: hypothetical protein VMR43_08350 [Variovorax sp.]|nr:hypothetical protein [Variovorax sp.]